MPLNYSKWDQLELSDDSDIEGHPNVDKRSLIRWKQRDIHEKREIRKTKIASLSAEIACNDVLLLRLRSILDSLKSPDPSFPSLTSYFNSLVDRLQRDPSPEKPPTNSLGQVAATTYDAMVLSLLMQVSDAAKKKVEATQNHSDAELGDALIEELNHHVVKLGEVQNTHRQDLALEENEQKKHITSEDMHDGFQNKYVPPKPAPPPVPLTKVDKPKKTKTEATTSIEVLNPGASSPNTPSVSSADPDDDSEDEADALPELTSSLLAFSHLPLHNYDQSFAFIQAHRDVVVPGAADALLVAAFRAQSANNSKYAKQCVHQSLLLQYCDKLGGDGVRVFFKKMIQGDKRAEKVFVDDVESTYGHLVTRAAASAASEGTEQIQLVPENPTQTISFNVPTGPPPENLTLEGPGTEDLDIEEVRTALQLRWDVFDGFEEDLKEALREGTLDGVNKILGSMPVEEAEDVVGKLDMAGILSFAEGGIRDETGKAKEEEEVE
jgi:cell division cycle protein 37